MPVTVRKETFDINYVCILFHNDFFLEILVHYFFLVLGFMAQRKKVGHFVSFYVRIYSNRSYLST